VALSLLLIGLFLMVTRKKAITQILALLTVENAVFLVAVGVTTGLPLGVEFGIAFAVIVAVQVPAIVKSDYPVLRAVEVLSVVIPLFLLIFSRIYLSNSIANPASFSQSLDHTTAFYFTVTVFATVGFGDIVATTNSMKLLVTVQMLLNLAVLGAVIRVVTSAAQRGIARKKEVQRTGQQNPPTA